MKSQVGFKDKQLLSKFIPLRKFFAISPKLLALLVVSNLVTFYDIRFLGAPEVLWLFTLVPVTGSILLSLLLDLKKFRFAEWLIYSVGLGLAFDMILGLIVNTVGLLVHQQVLTPGVLIPLFDAVFLSLLLARSLYSKSSRLFPRLFPDVPLLLRARILLPLLFPLISVLGATRLNNGGSNSVALSLIVLICLYVICLMLVVKRRYEAEYLTSLFAIGIALGLSFSMRSNHILGFDINGEFRVFSTVVSNGFWLPHQFPGNAYNACLSITVLPAFLYSFMRISTEYFFKILMEGLLGIIPIVVYVIATERFKTQRYLAYIAALFFAFQVQFILEFPALIRQQVAVLFFGLIFAVAINGTIPIRIRKLLILLFGLAMIPSHYSTAYVCIGLLLLITIFDSALRGLRRLMKIGKTKLQKGAQSIPFTFVLAFGLVAFLWYGETLQASGGLLAKLSNSITNFSSIFNADSHSQFVIDSFGIGTTTYNDQSLEQISTSNAVSGGYRIDANQYQPTPISLKVAAPTSTLQDIVYSIEHKFIPLAANGLIVVGLLYMIFITFFKGESLYDAALGLSSGCLFLLLAVLPSISVDYNLERLYQQLLVLIAPAFIFGLAFLLRFRFQYVKYIGTIVLVVYLSYSSGLIDQVVFGDSNVNLTNGGTNYIHFYLNDGAVYSLKWLQASYSNNSAPVNVDYYSYLSLEGQTNIPLTRVKRGVFPTEITPNSYVYVSQSNLRDAYAFDYYQNEVVTYNFPRSFLDEHKNLIFSNKDSAVYK